MYKQAMSDDYQAIKKQFKNVGKILNNKVPGTVFTNDNAIRVYLWDKAGYNIPGLDLSEYQIYNDITELDPNSPCCFLQSLIASNKVHISKINRAKQLIKTRDIPACKLNELCIDLHIHITIQNTTNKILHYPNGKDELSSFIRELEPIKLGLLNEHYFYKEGKTNITSYAIKHYEDIKDIKDFNKIYKKVGDKYKKATSRLKKGGKWQDAHQAVTMLLNE